MIFSLFSSVITIAVFVIFGIVLFRIVSEWHKNNQSPRLTVPAVVVAKRGHTTHHHDAGNIHHSHSSTTYYVTFQFESGDRLELHVPSSQFGYLVEGDRGNLTFQGTRFLGFERT
jgi:hypothetical protein